MLLVRSHGTHHRPITRHGPDRAGAGAQISERVLGDPWGSLSESALQQLLAEHFRCVLDLKHARIDRGGGKLFPMRCAPRPALVLLQDARGFWSQCDPPI